MKYLFYILSLTFLISCTRDVEIDLDDIETQIVVEAGIETGQGAFVYLTKSTPVFSEFDFNNVTEFVVSNAVVTVSNGVLTDTLTPFISLSNIPPLYYRAETPTVIGEEGKSYSLKVEVDGKVITSSTTIPEIIKLDSSWIKEEEGFPGKGFIWASLNDPDSLGNGYFWKQQKTTEDKFVAPLGAAFDDRIFNGQNFEFFFQKPVFAEEQEADDFDPTTAIYYDLTDTVIIKFSCIDKASMNFWRTVDMSKNNGGNPFASPISPISNVEGGLGVFTGYAVSYDTAFYQP